MGETSTCRERLHQGSGQTVNTLPLYLGAVVAERFDWATFHIDSLPTAVAALFLPGTFRSKVLCALLADADVAWTPSAHIMRHIAA